MIARRIILTACALVFIALGSFFVYWLATSQEREYAELLDQIYPDTEPANEEEYFYVRSPSRDEEARVQLGQIGTNIFPFLLEELTHKEAKRRIRAKNTFWLLREQAHVTLPTLVTLLAPPEPNRQAMDVLRIIGPQAKPGIPALLKIIESSDDQKLRARALYVLAGIGEEAESVIPALTRIIESEPDLTLKLRAVNALGRLSDTDKSIQPLMGRLNHNEDAVRAETALNLRRFSKHAKLTEPQLLNVATNDSSKYVRRCAVEALGYCGEVETITKQILVRLLADDIFKITAAQALAHLKVAPERALPILVEYVGVGREPGTQIQVDRERSLVNSVRVNRAAIVNYGEKIIPDLRQMLRSKETPIKHGAMVALVDMNATAAANDIKALLADPDTQVRKAATNALRILQGTP